MSRIGLSREDGVNGYVLKWNWHWNYFVHSYQELSLWSKFKNKKTNQLSWLWRVVYTGKENEIHECVMLPFYLNLMMELLVERLRKVWGTLWTIFAWWHHAVTTDFFGYSAINSTTSQRCSVKLRSDDGGGHCSPMNSLSSSKV